MMYDDGNDDLRMMMIMMIIKMIKMINIKKMMI